MKNIILFILAFPAIIIAQNSDTASIIPVFSVSYSFQMPGGDLADRYGNNSNIGGSFQIKAKKNLFIIEGNFLFGNQLKDEAQNIFQNIETSDGYIIDRQGEYANVILSERGFFIGGRAGRIIPVFKNNTNSGFMFNIGAGLLQHKIRIENDGNRAPQILNDYKKGYDRLTNGFTISEFVGYFHLDKNHITNFYGGIELYQAWTKCRRDFNFDTMEKDDKERLDLLFGIKIGWMIPVYKRMSDGHYYY
ncbi:MAG: hypothetical protein Kow0068_10390 [Marinilabiliales bacterium]